MKYSLLLISMIATQARAQIIYTDVVPDQFYNANGDTAWLDLDNDGTMELYLSYHHAQGALCTGFCSTVHSSPSWVRASTNGATAVADTLGSYPLDLDEGRAIDASLTWISGNSQTLASQTGTSCINFMGVPVCMTPDVGGEWPHTTGIVPRYLGVRFSAGGSTHYGWVRAGLVGNPMTVVSMTIYSYAYNSVPDEMILAGDTGSFSTSVMQHAHRTIHAIPNPTHGKFTVAGLDPSFPASLEIRNTMGQVVHRSSTTGPLVEIDLSSQPGGLYFLVVRNGEHVVTRRIIKE